jgi:HEAT repeat protein
MYYKHGGGYDETEYRTDGLVESWVFEHSGGLCDASTHPPLGPAVIDPLALMVEDDDEATAKALHDAYYEANEVEDGVVYRLRFTISPKSEEGQLRLLERIGSADTGVRQHAVNLLGQMISEPEKYPGDKARIMEALLTAAQTEEYSDIRCEFVYALAPGVVGMVRVQDLFLRWALDDKDLPAHLISNQQLRCAALRALLWVESERVLNALRDIATSDDGIIGRTAGYSETEAAVRHRLHRGPNPIYSDAA